MSNIFANKATLFLFAFGKGRNIFFLIISIIFSIFGIKSDVTILWSFKFELNRLLLVNALCFVFWSFDSSSQSYVTFAKFIFLKNDAFISPPDLSEVSIMLFNYSFYFYLLLFIWELALQVFHFY